MSLLNKKTDVQKHLSHLKKHHHMISPATDPNGTGFSGEDVATTAQEASVEDQQQARNVETIDQAIAGTATGSPAQIKPGR